MIVALRHGTAYRLAQSGDPVAPPVSLGIGASGDGATSPNGTTLAHEGVEICGIVPRACVSTFFRSLTSGAALIGKGLQMQNPAWVGDSAVIGVVGCSVSITGPNEPNQRTWLDYTAVPEPLPNVGVGTQCAEAAAASSGGTRVAVSTTPAGPGTQGDRVLWLLTAPALGNAVTAQCWQQIPAGPEVHPVWAPDASAIAWAEADGVWTESVVDLTGTDEGCQANAATAKLVAPGGARPSWSPAPYDPRAKHTRQETIKKKQETVNRLAVRLSGLTISPKRFRAARTGATTAIATGARVRYRLSRAATVNFKVERRVLGRRVERHCLPARRRTRKRARCYRYIALKGGFADHGRRGSSSFRYRGRLRGRRLRPGSYRLVARPRRAGDRASQYARFEVVR